MAIVWRCKLWDTLASGPIELISGAVVGLVLGALFEEWLKRQIASVGRLLRRLVLRRPDGPDLGREFRLGPLHVPVRILEGDGVHAIHEGEVRVLVNPVNVRLPDELVQWRAEIAAEQARRQEVGEPYAWNGASYAVEDLIIERVGSHESPAVTLILKYCDYYTFLATQMFDRRLRGGGNLRSRYLDGRDSRDVPDFMRSCFGQNMAVVTADNWLLVSCRGEEVHTARGLWNSSANESLSRDKDSINGGPPSLFQAARRGLREELHLLPHQYGLQLLAFHEVTTLCQWGSLFLARLHTMSKKDVEEHLTRGIEDGWEHKDFDYVRFEPEPVLRYLLREDRRRNWGPAAPVLLYLSLVNAYGRQRVDAAAAHVLRGSP
ncbi:hypothetical protein ACIBO1_31370 [Micromonospora sp. NPDC049903]|uniref:hypothetical protein n=1 Tax=Micromonospora sp. NPDC049903 TaxID=3364276 RepID=UPI0037940E51